MSATASSRCRGGCSTPCASSGWSPGKGSRNRPASSATSSASSTPTATSRSTRPWSGWPRTSPPAIRSSTARAISAMSTAITRRPCATPKRASPMSPWRCWRASTRTPATFAPTMTARTPSRSCCPPASPISWPTAPAASPWAWRLASRRTMPPSCAPPWSISSTGRARRSRRWPRWSPGRTSPPEASWRTRPRPSGRPMRRGGARSGCARHGASRSWRGAVGRSWSPRFPGRCRNRVWWDASPS